MKNDVMIDDISIDDIEQEFALFVEKVNNQNKEVSTSINMDELDGISDEIIKAKEYLLSFASGEKKTVREKLLGQLTNVPLIGDWTKDKIDEIHTQNLKDSGAEEVLEGIYSSFYKKQKRLVELTAMIYSMKENMEQNEIVLNSYIVKLDNIINNTANPAKKMKALEMSVTAQAQDKILKEMLYNNINIIMELMASLHTKITKTLPVIRNTLDNSIKIVGTVNAIKDAVEMMNALESLTNEINQKSTESIQELIIESTKTLSEGTDIEFYKKSAERNQKFNKALLEARKQHITKTVEDFNTLKAIGEDVSNQLQHRVDKEKEILELSFEGKYNG